MELTLYQRDARRLRRLRDLPRVRLVEGDVPDRETLGAATAGQDAVYANLSGDMGAQARLIDRTMEKLGPRRLIFISRMAIYDEVPGQFFHAALRPNREAAEVIEASDLEHTILRPAWLNDPDEIDCGTTREDEAFENPDGVLSRRSVADLTSCARTAFSTAARSATATAHSPGDNILRPGRMKPPRASTEGGMLMYQRSWRRAVGAAA